MSGDSLQNRLLAWSHRLEEVVASRTRELSAAAEKNALLYQQLQRQEATRRRLLHKVIDAQEAERKRIARELHDSTAQELVALALRLDRFTDDNPGVGAGLTPIKALCADILAGIHRLLVDLRPAMLDDLGLAAALRGLCGRQLPGAAAHHRFEITGDERRLPPELETTLYRVAQEALGNVARHAQASHVLLTLTYDDGAVVLVVEDDGVGFDRDAVVQAAKAGTSTRGLGLLGMRERVALWDGRVDIESARDQGCRIVARVPYPPPPPSSLPRPALAKERSP